MEAWDDAQTEQESVGTVFNQSNYGPVVDAGRDAHHITQTVTVGPNLAEVAKWLNAVRQALPAAGVAEDHAGRVEAALERLQEQVSAASPQPSKLRELGSAAVLAVAEAQAVAGSEYMLSLLVDAGRAIFGG